MTFAPWRVGAWRWWMPPFLAGLVSAIALGGLSGADQTAIPGSSDAPVLRADTFARVARARRRSVVFLHTIARDSSTGTSSRGASPLGPQRPRVIEPIREGLGSGVVIDVAGLILTNAHVIDRADAIHLRTTDGDDIEVTIVGIDPELDVALVRAVDAAGLRPAPLGDSDRVKVGEWVLAIGNPFGLCRSPYGRLPASRAGGGLEPRADRR